MTTLRNEVQKGFNMISDSFEEVEGMFEDVEKEIAELKMKGWKKNREILTLKKKMRRTQKIQTITTALTIGVGVTTMILLRNKSTPHSFD